MPQSPPLQRPSEPSAQHLRALRILVAVLGVIFVLCAVTFIYLLVTVTPESGERFHATTTNTLTGHLDTPPMNGTISQITLQEGEAIAHYEVEGSVIIVLIEGKMQSRLVRIDMPTGTHRTVALFSSPHGRK